MALRLDDSSNTPAPRPDGAALAARAGACLTRGDLNAWSALFADADGIEDPQRRYEAKRMLVEAALAATPRLRPQALPALFAALAERSIAWLEADPLEPLVLNYAGVALYELGSLDAARDLFLAARRLDPELPHLESNLQEIDRRRRRGQALALPKPIAAALPALAKRASAGAAAAHPVQGLKLSLCMIVKDEEEMLPRSLAAVRDAVDEIIVVDTGSTDRSVEIAREHGAKVLHHEWTGDFSAARNVSFEAATGDWILYLDADEVLVTEDAALLRELTGRVWREAFYLVETNHTGAMEDGTAVTHNALRMFRNRPEYRFEGRIHEQIAHRLPAYLPERLELSRVRVEHYGYLGAVRDAKEKSRRNIELLERQIAEGADSPFLHFNLGSEMAAAGDARAALAQFERAWELLQGEANLSSYGFVPSLVSRLVKARRVNGDLAGAETLAQDGLAIFPGFTDLVFEQAAAARERGDLARALALLERCLEMGDAPSGYSATVGCGSYLALSLLAELRAGRGELPEAERLLVRCLDEHPGFLGSVYPLAEVLLRRGAETGDVVARIEESVESLTPSVRFMLGTALYEAGHAAEAEEQFRTVLEAQPGSDPARVALAEALLSQTRYHEAAQLAREVPPGSGCAAAASRSELFANVVSGQPLAGALARAEACRLPDAETKLFAAWESGDAGALAPGATPLLITALEALLRVQEFEHFERLLALLDHVGLTWRERRQLLAGMYFRRGYLESAADEWIAVCDRLGPDADALVGLAQVATAQGLREDALLFAQEARELAPERPDAAALVSTLGG